MCWCRPEIRTPNCGGADCNPPPKTIPRLLEEIDLLREAVRSLTAERDKLKIHKKLLFEENGRLLEEKESGIWDRNPPVRGKLKIAVEALEVAGNACGIGATFLEFHVTKKTKQSKNCIQQMKNHEEMALSVVEKLRGEK